MSICENISTCWYTKVLRNIPMLFVSETRTANIEDRLRRNEACSTVNKSEIPKFSLDGASKGRVYSTYMKSEMSIFENIPLAGTQTDSEIFHALCERDQTANIEDSDWDETRRAASVNKFSETP
ncbi:hypothetical protein AVEN_5846-1 [Araneus ventricosus]|uniref:Uncharacterized protein n=1 Tax=Araneus ventricosus TaxID=182803 RepID=A0A4Y2S5B1_ARAVE|nr:hypothetical protein AVEN_5846-1 [Araneus ventricosus]